MKKSSILSSNLLNFISNVASQTVGVTSCSDISNTNPDQDHKNENLTSSPTNTIETNDSSHNLANHLNRDLHILSDEENMITTINQEFVFFV
jgi:hypothetical protein